MDSADGSVEYAIATADEDDDPESLIGEAVEDDPRPDGER
jgi:hypothetical protein